MQKQQAYESTITLRLTYAELQELLSLCRVKVRQNTDGGTVSDWHPVAKSLLSKIETEARTEV